MVTRRRYRRHQRGGKNVKRKIFDIRKPTRHDIPMYADVSNLRKKYKTYRRRKKQQQKGGFLPLLAGLGALGGIGSLFG